MKKLLLSIAFVLTGCGGGGTTESTKTTPVIDTSTYTFSTDISSITYPGGYATPSSYLLTASNPCELTLPNITIPKEWLGNYTLPDIRNAPLQNTVVRAVALKDIMLHDNPSFTLNSGCTGELRAEFIKTVARLKLLGVEQLTVPQWHWMSKDANNRWFVTKAENTFGSLIDSDLAELVKVAHAVGIKVVVLNQIQGMIDSPTSESYVPDQTHSNHVKWFEAFYPFMLERATFFQSIGVDVVEVGCGSCIFSDVGSGSTQAIELAATNYVNIIDEVKNRYTGKLLMYINPLLFSETFRNKIDIIALYSGAAKFTAEENSKLTVDSYKTAIKNQIYDTQNLRFWISLGKPLVVPFDIQSRSNALTDPGYVEETGCTGYIGSFNMDYNACIQKQQKPDFSLQAIVFQATLEAINEVSWPPGSIVVAQGYWVTDVMNPHTAYPNISASFRNKPAEKIIKAWYKK